MTIRSVSGSRVEQLEMTADDRDRRAQLVAGVGDELALERERLLEPVEHRVEQVPELGDLVVALRRRSGG